MSRVTLYSLDYSFPNLEPVCCSMSNSNCCFLTCIEISQEVRWSGSPISLRIFQSLLWSTQSKALALSIKQMFFWNSCFFDDSISRFCLILSQNSLGSVRFSSVLFRFYLILPQKHQVSVRFYLRKS